MLLGEIIRVALGALRANKLRSLLTMLGIVIGVAAVIAVVALGTGAQSAVKERISSLGTTLLTIIPGQQRGMGGISFDQTMKLTMDDAKAIEDRAPSITAVQPEMTSRLQVQYLTQNTNTSIVGTTANYLEVRKYELDVGRMFSRAEDEGRQRVCVLGPAVLEALGIESPDAIVGEPVRIRGIQFTVVGVLKSKGQSTPFGNPDDQVLVPITTGRFRLFGSDRLRSISVLAESEEKIPDAMADVQRVLRREHRLGQNKPDDFQIRSQADFLNTLGETTQVFTYLLSGIAAVSLLVGGIGIMNIMLVSVTERTREIGIRKALGATRANILLQFLIEAVVLCLMGGLIGALVGSGGATAMSAFFQWNTIISPSAIVAAFAFSAMVGVLFGVWPARRAASLDPIVALRYE
ncbi:MAG TPA: ABC transporter permease [Gemmatimonadaceae bacterium]|jgi:putative ABC transport system permease protein|nr:ABC transporter permease [Gemmatimonadaceae bacterium]